MINPIVGVYANEILHAIFLDVTKIVFYTRATNQVRLVCGLELSFTEENMKQIMDRLNDIHISNTATNTTR
jgi:hypothetical protein